MTTGTLQPDTATSHLLESGVRGTSGHSTLEFRGGDWNYNEVRVTPRGALVLDTKHHEHQRTPYGLCSTDTVRLVLNTHIPQCVEYLQSDPTGLNAYGVEWTLDARDGWVAYMPVEAARVLWVAATRGWLMWVGENTHGTRVKHPLRESWTALVP
ncbi:hypothetical protein EBZ39_12500 [bacterium]|nr:hypothetical protein [bacterium]